MPPRSVGVLALLLAGCVLQDYSRGRDAAGEGRHAEAIDHFRRALRDPGMTRELRLRAIEGIVDSAGALGRLDEQREALDAGASILLEDYALLDMTPKERAAIHPLLRMRASWRVGLRAVEGLESTRTEALRARRIELGELHLRRALEAAPEGTHWEAEILLDLMSLGRATPEEADRAARLKGLRK